MTKSRTFFPARVTDNMALLNTGYADQLASLPEPLRSQLLYGDFSIGRQDGAWQAIPTSFIKVAQKRWTPNPPFPGRMTSLGADIARGGTAATCTAPKYGNWFGPLVAVRGADTNTGRKAAQLVKDRWRDHCPINLDVNGLGAACFEHLQDMLKEYAGMVRPINSGEPSEMRDRSGKFRLVNVRAAMLWSFREALDPELGSTIALPPDDELAADLAAPRYRVTAGGIIIEPKEDVEKRLGGSIDKGDAVTLAHWQSTSTGSIGMSGDRNVEWGLGPPGDATESADEDGMYQIFGEEETPDREEREWWEDL
jgi:hypothetical protein